MTSTARTEQQQHDGYRNMQAETPCTMTWMHAATVVFIIFLHPSPCVIAHHLMPHCA